MPNPFSRLFESFETLSKEDGFEGIKSPYEQTAENMVGTALNDLDDHMQDFCNGITRVYQTLEPSMIVGAKGNVADRRQLSKSINDTLNNNGVLAEDALVRSKLSDILSYLYGHMNGGKYLILSDFNKAKQQANSLYEFAKRQRGFPQVSSSIDDMLKKVILAVIYKSEGESHGPSKQPPTSKGQADQQPPAPQA